MSPEEIDHVEASFKLLMDPTPHCLATLVTYFKDGSTAVAEGDLTGLDATEVALTVLGVSGVLAQRSVEVQS